MHKNTHISCEICINILSHLEVGCTVSEDRLLCDIVEMSSIFAASPAPPAARLRQSVLWSGGSSPETRSGEDNAPERSMVLSEQARYKASSCVCLCVCASHALEPTSPSDRKENEFTDSHHLSNWGFEASTCPCDELWLRG
jgi:hypothetical protein